MRRPATLARRLSISVLAVGLLGTLLQGLLLHLWLQPQRDQLIDGTVLQVAAMHQALRAVPPAQRDAMAASLSSERVQLQRTRHWPAQPSPPPLALPGTPLHEQLQQRLPAGAKVHLPPRVEGEPGRLHVVWRLDGEIWEARFAAAPPLLAVGLTFTSWLLLMALLAGGALWLTVRVVTRPIERLAVQIAAQGQGERLQALPLLPKAGAEVDALVRAFNAAVASVQASQQQRQQLLAGVSHDLRTPLARLRLRVETQLQGPTADALDRDLQALQHIADQFLAYVQGETQPLAGPQRPLPELLRELVAPYAAQGVGLSIEPGLQTLARTLPETALRRCLSNLIDNALAHGRSPVRVVLHSGDDGLRLSVEDGGDGLPAADFERAQQPFVRLSEATDRGHCGLGLAIAAQMARQLGGRLQLRERRPAVPFAIELVLG